MENMENFSTTPIIWIFRQTLKKIHQYKSTTNDGEIIGYCKLRFNPLKEETVFSADEEGTKPLMIFRPNGKLIFNAIYEIIDAWISEPIGFLKRKRIKSPPEWALLDASGNEHALFRDSVRGFGGALLYNLGSASSVWDYIMNGEKVAEYHPENKSVGKLLKSYLKGNPDKSRKIRLDFSSDQSNTLDRRLALAAAILVCTMEISRATPT